MIRRLFWLSAGAAIGITGYRRAEALGRAASARLTVPASAPAGAAEGRMPAAGSGTYGRRPRRSAVARVRGAVRFARDVRDGMDMYMDRHQGRLGPTLRRSVIQIPAQRARAF